MSVEYFDSKKDYMVRIAGSAQKKVFSALWSNKIMRSKEIVLATDLDSGSIVKAIKVLSEKGWVDRVDYGLYSLNSKVKGGK